MTQTDVRLGENDKWAIRKKKGCSKKLLFFLFVRKIQKLCPLVVLSIPTKPLFCGKNHVLIATGLISQTKKPWTISLLFIRKKWNVFSLVTVVLACTVKRIFKSMNDLATPLWFIMAVSLVRATKRLHSARTKTSAGNQAQRREEDGLFRTFFFFFSLILTAAIFFCLGQSIAGLTYSLLMLHRWHKISIWLTSSLQITYANVFTNCFVNNKIKINKHKKQKIIKNKCEQQL